jgi:hypothetical protein
VIAFNLVGDAIRDALDPHVQEMWAETGRGRGTSVPS